MYSYVSISDNLLSCTSTCSLAYSPLVAYQRWTLKDAIFANNDKITIVVVLQLKKCIAQYENIHHYNNSLQPNSMSLHPEHPSSSNIVCGRHPRGVGLEEIAHWREARYRRIATNGWWELLS